MHEPVGRRVREALRAVRSRLSANCHACAEPGGYPLCKDCRARSGLPLSDAPVPTPAAVAPVDATCHLAPYEPAAGFGNSPLRGLLVRFKYAGDRSAGYALMAVVRLYADAVPFDVDAIVPVPLHRTRLLARGYNQAAWLARAYATTRRRTLVAGALSRPRPTPAQAGLTRESRLRTVRGTFHCAERNVGGRSILLVDDVVTTGATTRDAARALKEAGAARVFVFSLMATA